MFKFTSETKLTADHECGVLERVGRMMSYGCLPSRYLTENIGKAIRTTGGGRDGYSLGIPEAAAIIPGERGMSG